MSSMAEKNPSQFPFLTKLINGGIAGIIGVACVFPLDLVKTRLQNQPVGPGGEKMYSNMLDAFKKTYSTEGFCGMYRGSAITIVFIIPEKASALAANDYFRYKMQTREGTLPMYRQMIAGGLAGLCQILLTTPTELLKIRMQDAGRMASQDRKSIQRTSARCLALDIVKQNGISGLYRGVTATMLRDVTFSMIFYPLFASLNALGPRRAAELDESVFWWSFISGYISGSFSALCVTPFDVAKTRIQALREANSGILNTGMGDTLLNVFRFEGSKALFKGGACRMLVIAPVFGITQAVYYVGIAEYLLGMKK